MWLPLLVKNFGEVYELNIIEHNIETFSNNFTRFLLISKDKDFSTSFNKATLCFSVKHDVGSLAEALSCIAKNEMNLTKIQSFPKNWKILGILFLC